MLKSAAKNTNSLKCYPIKIPQIHFELCSGDFDNTIMPSYYLLESYSIVMIYTVFVHW